jgi:hypothetical protein
MSKSPKKRVEREKKILDAMLNLRKKYVTAKNIVEYINSHSDKSFTIKHFQQTMDDTIILKDLLLLIGHRYILNTEEISEICVDYDDKLLESRLKGQQDIFTERIRLIKK